MKKYFETLKKCPLFCDISEENLSTLLKCLGAKVEIFDKKYTIFREGNPARYIGIILSGSAQMTRIDHDGNRSLIATAEEGDMIGEAFACAEVKSLPVAVVADELCHVLLIDCGHILHTCNNACGFHQKLIFNLMKGLAAKNLMFHQKVEIISKRSTRDRIMTYLDFCAERFGSLSFDIPFDRQELADYLEVDRSGLSAEISRMKAEGIIYNHRSHFVLL